MWIIKTFQGRVVTRFFFFPVQRINVLHLWDKWNYTLHVAAFQSGFSPRRDSIIPGGGLSEGLVLKQET